MSIFLARYSRDDKDSLLDNIQQFYSYLPQKPLKERNYKYGNSQAIVFEYGAALDRIPVVVEPNAVILCYGYGDSLLEDRLNAVYNSNTSLNFENFPESFCSIKVFEGGIKFVTSPSGTDPLFFYEDDSQIIVTNRHNLLGHWLTKTTFRKEAFAWMVGRNHIGDFGTYWNEIQRARPGCVYIKSASAPLKQIAMNYSNIVTPISNVDIIDYIDDVAEYFESVVGRVDKGLRLWLSGGKDSRAIAGLLSKTSFFDRISFNTFGEKFQPDVMSSIKVAKELGVTDRHNTQRLSLEDPAVNISKGIAKDLCADYVGTSLADFSSINFSELLVIGGHESGFKSPMNILDLDSYIQSRRYWTDGIGLLNNDMHQCLNDWYFDELRYILSDIPRTRYSQMDAIVFRIGTYASSSLNNANVSRSEIHPFLDGKMVNLLLSITDDALKNQLIHYVMMRRSSAVIESIPFANDEWPQYTERYANDIGLPFRMKPESPYIFQQYFPSSKIFGGYSWRINLIERTRDFVYNYIHDNRQFFNFINLERLNKLNSMPLTEMHITLIYHQLSLLKVCLLHYFGNGQELFKFSLESKVENDLSTLFNTSSIKSTIAIEEACKAKLDDYEEAIANVAERDRIDRQLRDYHANISVAGKLAENSSDYEFLVTQLLDLGFIQLEDNGKLIGTIKSGSSYIVSGGLLSFSESNNKALLAIKNVPQFTSIDGFQFSESGFWYKYLNTSFRKPQVEEIIPLLNNDAEVWIMPWYSDKPIWISDFLIEIVNK